MFDDETGRRGFLRALGSVAVTAGLSGCSGWNDVNNGTDRLSTETAPGTRNQDKMRTMTPEPRRYRDLKSRYGTVEHAVEDLGCDSDGERSCVRQIAAAADDDTLVVFPEGEFRFDNRLRITGTDHLGIYGRPGATFVAPSNYNGDWLVIDRGTDLLVEGIDVDVRATNSAPSLQFGADDGLEIRDIEIVGRGMRDASSPGSNRGNVPVGSALLPIVRSPDGTGVVENFVARNGGRIGTYNHGDGRVGIFVGRSNEGTVRIVDCHLEEFPNNGIYASRTNGVIRVEGGYFRNNDISQVRLGTEGSVLDGTRIEVDTTTVRSPNRRRDYMNPRGVRIESGSLDTAGVEVRNTDIEVENSPGPSIAVGRNGGRFAIRDTRVRHDAGGGPVVVAKPPTGGDHHDAPPRPHHGTLSNVTITGSATDSDIVWLLDRPGSTLTNCRIDQPGDGTNGLHLAGSPDCTIRDTSITVSGFPIVTQPRTANVESCLVELVGTYSLPFEGDGSWSPVVERSGDADRICIPPASLSAASLDRPALALAEGNGGDLRRRILPASRLGG